MTDSAPSGKGEIESRNLCAPRVDLKSEQVFT